MNSAFQHGADTACQYSSWRLRATGNPIQTIREYPLKNVAHAVSAVAALTTLLFTHSAFAISMHQCMSEISGGYGGTKGCVSYGYNFRDGFAFGDTTCAAPNMHNGQVVQYQITHTRQNGWTCHKIFLKRDVPDASSTSTAVPKKPDLRWVVKPTGLADPLANP